MDQESRRTVYTLRFEHHGDLSVRTRKPSLRALLLLGRVVRVLGEDMSGQHVVSEDKLVAWGHLADAFAEALVSWNLRDFGRPVPATRAGVCSQDLAFILDLATTWYRRVALAPEVTVQPTAQESAPDPVPREPSAGELALLNIPVQIGNDALNPEAPVEPEYGELSA